MIKTYTATIDLEVTITDLIDAWVNGNCEFVIDTLRHDHPGVAAVVMAQGLADGKLDSSDLNSIANQLIDDRCEYALGNRD